MLSLKRNGAPFLWNGCAVLAEYAIKEAGVHNMSAYIRKMALNGYVIISEWPDLNRVISLHTRISNNLNQYAKKANETGKLYEEDIAEIKKMQIWIMKLPGRILRY